MNATRCVFAAALLTAGCNGADQAVLKGKVTLDGEPVENGSITFYSMESDGSKAAAAIQNGEYVVPADRGLKPGTYKVEVSWQKPTGKKIASADPGMMMDQTVEAIPRKYNVNSELTVEVGPGETVKDFPLTSK